MEREVRKTCSKRCGAKWGSKHGTPTFGYKAHVAVDNKNKIIHHIETTQARVFVAGPSEQKTNRKAQKEEKKKNWIYA